MSIMSAIKIICKKKKKKSGMFSLLPLLQMPALIHHKLHTWSPLQTRALSLQGNLQEVLGLRRLSTARY